MGNIKGWGGPVSLTFLHNELLLNKQIVEAGKDCERYSCR